MEVLDFSISAAAKQFHPIDTPLRVDLVQIQKNCFGYSRKFYKFYKFYVIFCKRLLKIINRCGESGYFFDYENQTPLFIPLLDILGFLLCVLFVYLIFIYFGISAAVKQFHPLRGSVAGSIPAKGTDSLVAQRVERVKKLL